MLLDSAAQVKRFLEANLPHEKQRKIALITGARQTGKTTLAKKKYPSLPYFNLDALEYRQKIAAVPATQWAQDLGPTIIDEAQKSPDVFEKIKYAYDAGTIDFSVLLGSSQILLLKKIRESLAGRVSIFELFPLTLAELCCPPQKPLVNPLIDALLTCDSSISAVLEKVPSLLFDNTDIAKKKAQDYLLSYGGMPGLLHLPETERFQWLRDYELTYLERDLSDLARLSDLQPFRIFQKLAALRSASLLNYSELARDASVSADTAKRYLEYLRLSYQVELLQPYYRNLTSSVIKTPKLYWLDIGIWRCLSGFNGAMSGQLYENYIISELIKWIKTARRPVEYYFYRSRSGLEVDCLLQQGNQLIGMEIKSRKKIYPQDAFAMKELSKVLTKEWKGGIIVYDGDKIQKIVDPHIWAIPGWRLLT
jgi:predicted AAA+ superfamily ATPase